MLYTSLKPWEGFPGVQPYIDSTLTESIDVKDPYNNPVQNGNWYNYSIYRNKPVPPSGEYTLPKHLYCICSGIKKFTTDFYYSGFFYRFIISEKFLSFLKEANLLAGEYDSCPVTIVSRKLEPLTIESYHVIRIYRFHNELIDWDNSPKVPKQGSVSQQVYYPELKLAVAEDHLPGMFFLDVGTFMDGFFCDNHIKEEMERRTLKGFALVSLSDYTAEHQFRDNNLSADKRTAQQRDALWFNK